MPAWLSQTLKRTRSGLSFLKRTKDKDSDSGLDTPGTTTPAIGSSTNNLTISYSYNHPLPDLPPGIATPATATDDDVPSAPPTNPAARAESRSDREKQKERDRRKGIRMPTLSSAHQRDAIREFMVITGQNERVAKQYMKATGFSLQQAVTDYFGGRNARSSPGAGQGAAVEDAALGRMFDELRASEDDKDDTIFAESSMKYIESLGLPTDDASPFVVLYLVQAPSVGTIERKGYIAGWKNAKVPANKLSHAQYATNLVSQLSTDADSRRRVFRYVFAAAREETQKAIPLEAACDYWDVLFAAPMRPWHTSSPSGGDQDWLSHWKRFLAEEWKKTVNRDMWNQTFEFAERTVTHGGIGFWNEDQAWPTVFDDFATWCYGKGGVAVRQEDGSKGKNEGEMDVDSS